MTVAARPEGRSPTRRKVLRRYLPPQHGAWAMLLVPYVAGVLLAPRRPVTLVVLLIAWLGGYLLAYYVFLSVKSRRPSRYVSQLRLYGPPTVLALTLVVVARPAVLLLAPVFAVGVAANGWFAWRRQERALVNDLVSVAQSCAVLPAVLLVAGVPPVDLVAWGVVGPLLVILGYFVGTVLFVKTVIRERGNVTYLRASILVHGVMALAAFVPGLAGIVGPAPAVFFWWLMVRAAWLGGWAMRPARAGALEAVNSLLVLLVVASTW